MGTRQESPLLIMAAVHGVFDEIFPNPAIMEQGRTLARGSVARNRFALPRRSDQKLNQGQFGLFHLAREAIVPPCGSQSGPSFFLDQLLNARLNAPCMVLRAAGVYTERTAVSH